MVLLESILPVRPPHLKPLEGTPKSVDSSRFSLIRVLRPRDRWDRVEGRIESLIQSQRERNRSGPDLG